MNQLFINFFITGAMSVLVFIVLLLIAITLQSLKAAFLVPWIDAQLRIRFQKPAALCRNACTGSSLPNDLPRDPR